MKLFIMSLNIDHFFLQTGYKRVRSDMPVKSWTDLQPRWWTCTAGKTYLPRSFAVNQEEKGERLKAGRHGAHPYRPWQPSGGSRSFIHEWEVELMLARCCVGARLKPCVSANIHGRKTHSLNMKVTNMMASSKTLEVDFFSIINL